MKFLYDAWKSFAVQVMVDGNNVKELNVAWLRKHIGVVGQEPVLFNTTISENISFGAEGATEKDIEEAAREANAHDFISKLPMVCILFYRWKDEVSLSTYAVCKLNTRCIIYICDHK